MYERIEDKIRSVENYNTTIPFLKHLTKSIIEEYIIEINICIILIFTILYYFLLTPEDFNSKNKMNGFIDHLYFSIITHSAIGYGDISPKSKFGKLLVILHTCLMLLANIMLFS